MKINIPKNWQIRKIKDVLFYEQPTKYIVENDVYDDSMKTPVLTANKSFVLGYTNENEGIYKNIPVILFDDFTTDIKYVDFSFKVKSSAIKILKNIDSGTNLKFMFEIMKTLDFRPANHKRHYISEYQELEFYFPPLFEQNKIAEILTTVDDEIEKVDQIIAQTEKLKKGLIQDLFSKGINHTKFKKTKLGMIPEDWEAVKLKESLIQIEDGDRGKNYPKQKEFFNNEYCLFLNNKNIKNDSFIFDELQFITKEKDGLLRKGKLQRNDIVLTTRGTVGNAAFYNDSVQYENIRINSGMVILRCHNDYFPNYFYHLFKSCLMKKKYKEITSGSAQPQLPIRTLENIYILIPSRREQEKIADIAQKIDNKLLAEKKLKKVLIKLKKGLMQDLLSGKVRVNINY